MITTGLSKPTSPKAHALFDTDAGRQKDLNMERSAAQSANAAPGRAAFANAHLKDLRSTLQWLKQEGDLVETDKEVDPELEVTGLQKLMDGGCPVLFNRVKSKPNHRVLTNLFGSIEVMNRMFGWPSDKERTI